MDPALALRLPLEVLDDVRDVCGRAVDPGLLHRLVEQPTCRADERLALLVLLVARLLPDEHDLGLRRPLAEHRLRPGLPERTGLAAGRGLAELLQALGLGRAYIDALPYVRGEYILMGDADCTYDFRLLAPFVEKLREGYEFVMGSRWAGSIEPGAMPWLHQYLGTPVTTWILNLLYGSRFSDIHCGMRAIRRDSFERMNLTSQSWEYASEMVLKSVRMDLRTAEVPVRFLKDREGRESHHKRAGWTAPWKAAWINLRAMFVYGADFFVLKPGLLLLGARTRCSRSR